MLHKPRHPAEALARGIFPLNQIHEALSPCLWRATSRAEARVKARTQALVADELDVGANETS